AASHGRHQCAVLARRLPARLMFPCSLLRSLPRIRCDGADCGQPYRDLSREAFRGAEAGPQYKKRPMREMPAYAEIPTPRGSAPNEDLGGRRKDVERGRPETGLF